MKTFKFYQKAIWGLLLLFWGSQLNAQQVLVSGTSFEVKPSAQGETFTGIENLVYTGLMTPTLSVSVPVAPDVDYVYNAAQLPISSHFQSTPYYAITDNPIKLDSLHYVDNAPAYTSGIVFSPTRVTANTTILQYGVSGLKPGTAARVVIEYRSVVDPLKYTACGTGGSRFQFKVAVNADQYNLTQGNDVNQIGMNQSGTYNNTAVTVKADGTVDVRINAMNSYSGDCAAFEITKIEVYGVIAPEIYCLEGNEVCAGEQVSLRSLKEYAGATYQWYHNNAIVPGATNPSYLYEMPAAAGAHTFRLDVKVGATTISSNTLTVNAIVCCMIGGVPASRKIVYMDDFGEFDLNDPTGKTYKVWDYSDIKNPKQVTKTTTTPFRYPLATPPLGATFSGGPGPLYDGYYCVAGVLTGYNPVVYNGTSLAGASLEWANRVGGFESSTGIHYDHSGKLEGACLFLNCPPNTGGQVLYSRTLENLCSGKQLFFECYITVFTSSAAGAYNPVDITVKLTEIGNPSNVVSSRATATIQSAGGTGTWVKISQQIFLVSGDGIQLDIINNENTDQNGNDLALDDIIIRACGAPSIKAYFDLSTLSMNETSCLGDDIKVYAKPSDMLTNYFGGPANASFLYQWTTTPLVKTSWKNIGTPSQSIISGDLTSAFAGLNSGDKVYFRVIAGTANVLNGTAASDFNEDDPCANYTISNPIEVLVDCPKCTESKSVVISSNKSAPLTSGIKRVSLCFGESVELGTNDITPVDGYSDYVITWYKGNKTTVVGTLANPGVTANPLMVSYGDVSAAGATGVKYYVRVADRAFETISTCYKWDSILVVGNPSPVITPITDKALCTDEASGAITFSSTVNGTTYTWSNDNTNIGLSASGTDEIASFTGTNATSSPITGTITVTPTANSCEGTPITFEITVNPKAVITLTSATGTDGQTVCQDAAITSITYTLSGGATDATVSGLPAGVTSLVSGGILTISGIPTESGSFSYTITTTGHIAPCSAATASGTLTVNAIPTITGVTPNERCGDGTVVLEAIASAGIVNWYSTETGGIALGTGASYTTVSLSTTTDYWVDATANGCTTATRTKVTATIKAIPVSPEVDSYISCPTPSATMITWASRVTASGTLTWYDVSAGGSPIADPGSFNTSTPQTKSYWVTQSLDGCESLREELQVAISSEPSNPTINSYSSCAEESGTVKTWSELVTSSGTLSWYSADSDASILGSEPTSFNTGTVMSLTTYYVIVTDGQGCKTNRVAVTAEVKARPTGVLSDNSTICKGDNASLTVTFTGTAPFQFTYSDGTMISPTISSPTNSYTISNLSPSTTTSYSLASLSDAQCAALTTDMSGNPTITVNDRPTLGTIPAINALCSGGSFTPSNPSITENGSPVTLERWEIGESGVFSAINIFPYTVSDSDNGKTLRFVAGNACGESTTDITITVHPLPVVPSITLDDFCQGGTAPSLGGTISGLTIEWQDASGSPVTSISSSTGNTPGVHNYTAIATDANGCVSAPSTIPVEVIANPTIPTVNNDVVYYREDLQTPSNTFKDLMMQDGGAVTASSGSTLYWSADGLSWSTTPPVPPTPSEDDYTDKSYTYKVKQMLDGPTQCESPSTTVEAKIYLIPVPKVKKISYCEGETPSQLSSPTVEVDPTGGYALEDFELRWHGTGATPSTGYTTAAPTPSASTPGTTTYWVSQYNKGTLASSSPVKLEVIVYAKPTLSITAPLAVCSPLTVNISGNSGVWNVTNNTESFPVSDFYYEDINKTTILSTPGAIPTIGKRDYYIQVAYTMPSTAGGDSYCYSEVNPVEVNIEDLDKPVITGVSSTCPNTAVTLTAAATSTNPGTVSYSWSGSNSLSGTSSSISTGNLAGSAGDSYTFSVTASAGTCSQTSDIHTITIGDGPVEGSMTISEPGSSTNPSVTFNNDQISDYYTCGGSVTIHTSYTGSDFQWKEEGSPTSFPGGGDLNVTPVGTKTYILSYVNGCPTEVKVKIHSIPLKVDSLYNSLEMCEGEPFSAKLNISCSEIPTIQWYKDSAPYSGSSSDKLELPTSKPSDSGVYSYKVTNRGCEVSGQIGASALKVKPYIQFTNQAEYVVERGEPVTMPLNISVPSSPSQPSTIEWKENGVIVNTQTSYTIPSVTQDHHFKIKLSDPDYCDASSTLDVLVDAHLELKIDLPDQMCYGETKILEIDTTGTGRFVEAGHMLQVFETIEMIRKEVSGWTLVGGKLHLEVSPKKDASYEVVFTYKEQKVTKTTAITVLQPIEIVVPDIQTICEGESVTLSLKSVSPAGTTVEWFDQGVSMNEFSETIIATPAFTPGSGHQSVYTYRVKANYSICEERYYDVEVKVDEPLRGTLQAQSPICEGNSSRLDASNYDATSYIWRSVSYSGEKSGVEQIERPTLTTEYYVEMSRGTCSHTDSITVEVNTKPRISYIDSIDIRAREIVMLPDYGTHPFTYGVDNEPVDNNAIKENLVFGKHSFYVIDALGCHSDALDYFLEAIKIFPPHFFSPNGDGDNDTWDITNIEVYPNAVVTIYDRFGKKLAEYKGSAESGWDGTYLGREMPTTDYWYVIEIKEINKEYTGHFTLLRR